MRKEFHHACAHVHERSKGGRMTGTREDEDGVQGGQGERRRGDKRKRGERDRAPLLAPLFAMKFFFVVRERYDKKISCGH